MNKTIYSELEDLLNGDDGILLDLRFGEGLDSKKVENFYKKLNSVSTELSNSEFVPKSFFDLIIDSIMVITSSININEDKNGIMEFLDKFTDSLKSFENLE